VGAVNTRCRGKLFAATRHGMTIIRGENVVGEWNF
jgi:hypothetical protein